MDENSVCSIWERTASDGKTYKTKFFNLDYATSGVGCTARGIFDAYRVYPQGYERTITIRLIR